MTEHKHNEEIFATLEPLVQGIGQLEIALGPQAAPVVQRVRMRLIEAMAARDRGDLPGAFVLIGDAMGMLTQLAQTLDPAEASLMRMVADRFQRALQRGNEGEAKQQAALMMERSGAIERKDK